MVSGPRRILIADRDPLSLHVLEVTLDDRQYLIQTASDPQSAKDLARQEPPDLVLIDSSIGADLAHHFRSEAATWQVPIILLRPPGQAPLDQNLVQCLTKPFSPLELLHLVSALLEG